MSTAFGVKASFFLHPLANLSLKKKPQTFNFDCYQAGTEKSLSFNILHL